MMDGKNDEFNIDELVSKALGNIEKQTDEIKQKNDEADPFSLENGFSLGAQRSEEDDDSIELSSNSGKYDSVFDDIETVDAGEQPLTGGVSLSEMRDMKSRRNAHAAGSHRKGKKEKKPRKLLKTIIWTVTIIVISLGIAAAGLIAMIDVMGFNFENPETEWVTIPEGSSTQEIAEILAEKQVIKYPFIFRVYSKLTGADGQYNYGDYELRASQGYDGIISALKKAGIQAPEVTVTIPERSTVDEIRALLVKNEVCSEDEFNEAMKNGSYSYDFVSKIPNEKVYYRFEGYLSPNTYNFFKKTEDTDGVKNAERAIDKMLSQTDKIITADMKKAAKDKGYTVHEMLTMASILELEASGSPDQMSSVAQVFYNRLNWTDQPRLLGSTPTASYPYGNGRYDTNVYEGLPPGPLCSPSAAAIKAAFEPNTAVTATYFVTDKNMKFYYSNSLSEHNSIISELKSKGIWEY